MTDYTELKRLAEACGDLNWRAIQENWCEWAIRDDHAYIATMRTKSAKHPGPCQEREAKAKFLCAVTPTIVLALLDNLDEARNGMKYACGIRLKKEIDRLRAENEELRAQIGRAQIVELANFDWDAEMTALRKDAERYQWLRDKSESVHQFYLSTPIWFTGVKFSKENVDSTIDAAMSKEPQP
jgi:hypothetical protein